MNYCREERSQSECNDANSAAVQYLEPRIGRRRIRIAAFAGHGDDRRTKGMRFRIRPARDRQFSLAGIYTIFYYIFYTFCISRNISQVRAVEIIHSVSVGGGKTKKSTQRARARRQNGNKQMPFDKPFFRRSRSA